MEYESNDNLVKNIYNQFKIKSEQIFVVLQRLYIALMKYYYQNDLEDFLDYKGHVKEYEAISAMLHKSNCDERIKRVFSGAWKTANLVKHENYNKFEESYVRYCLSNYNAIVDSVLESDKSKFHIKIDLLKFDEETTMSVAFKKVLDGLQNSDVALKNKKHEEFAGNNLILAANKDIRKAKLHVFDCPHCKTRMVYIDNGKFGPYYKCNKCNKNFNEQRFITEFSNVDINIEESAWILSRARDKYAKVEFLQTLGISEGFQNYINTKRDEKDDLYRYSHWRIDYSIGKYKPSGDLNTILSLAYKIITRGKITLVSPYVNKMLNNLNQNNYNEIQDYDFLFKSLQYKDGVEHWLDGHGYEHKFYSDYLPKLMGEWCFNFVIPQADIKTLIGSNQDLGDQRVDFAIDDGKIKLVIELDDKNHKDHTEADIARDELLQEAGFTIIRVPNSELLEGNGENLRYLRDIFSEYRKTREISDIEKEIIQVKYVHQIQVAIIKALVNGGCCLSSKVHVNTNDNIMSADERNNLLTIAFDDLNELLNNISALCNQDLKFSLKAVNEDDAEYFISYDLTQKPLSNRMIICDIVYSKDFVNFPMQYSRNINYNLSQNILSYFLNYIFRKPSFLEGQYIVVCNVLKQKDSIVLLPTGAGKSIAFQLAGMLSAGITFVVSPLLSLMDDQIDNLHRVGIDRTTKIASDINTYKKHELLDKASQGEYHTIYISPERLQIKSFQKTLETVARDIYIPLFVIDEAHCLSEWGHDFRTSYLNVERIIKSKCISAGKSPTILALTGTASSSVLNDIKIQLNIYDEDSIITPKSFDRGNLKFSIIPCGSDEKENKLKEILEYGLPGRFGEIEEDFYKLNGNDTYCGIVFCPHINNKYGVYDLYKNLTNYKPEYYMGYYSGAKPSSFTTVRSSWEVEKKAQSEYYKNNRTSLLFATNAYGMGIDKPNIRYTIHYNLPKSVEAYYQEVGRAGRFRNEDGNRQPCECIMLASLDNNTGERLLDYQENRDNYNRPAYGEDDDVDRVYYFHRNAFKGADIEKRIINQVLYTIDLNIASKNYDLSKILKKIKDYYDENDNYLKSNPNKKSKRSPKDYKQDVEKAIYRLLLLGVVDDYLLVKNNEYLIKINMNFDRDHVKENYIEYIKKYNTQRVQGEMKKIDMCNVHAKDDKDYILNVCELMLKFNYSIIEKGRVEQIQLMYDIAKYASQEKDEIKQDEYIRRRILEVLSITERKTLSIILDSMNCGLMQIINLYESASKQRFKALISQGRRELESHPDHPGILLLSAFDLIEQDRNSYTEFRQRVEAAINSAYKNYVIEDEIFVQFMSWFIYNVAEKMLTQFGYKNYEDFCINVLQFFELELLLKNLFKYSIKNEAVFAPFILAKTSKLSETIMNILDIKERI